MFRFARLSVLVPALVIAACGAKADDAAAGASGEQGEPASASAEGTPGFDAAAAKAMLQGDWTVENGGKVEFTFSIKGDDVTVVSHQFAEPQTTTGKLGFDGPTKLRVSTPDGGAQLFRFVKVGDALHIGLGNVFVDDDLTEFDFKIGMFESVVRDAKGCRWKKDFGGKTEEREITCSVEDRDGKQVVTYQKPDHFDETKLATYELNVFGDVLLDEQMTESVAVKGIAAAE